MKINRWFLIILFLHFIFDNALSAEMTKDNGTNLSMNCVIGLDVAISDIKSRKQLDDFREYLIEHFGSITCHENEEMVSIHVNSISPDHYGRAVWYWISKLDFSIIKRTDMR